MKNTFIYSLSCPIDNKIKYIGKANNPKSRLCEHRRMRDNNTLKNDWIKSLLDNNLQPVLNILEEVSISDWKEREKFYISQHDDLLNICGGANGSFFGNKGSFNGSQARRVVSLNKDGTFHKTFPSMKESILSHGSSVRSVLYKKTKTAHGYIWIFEDEYKELSKNELQIIVDYANNNMSNISWKNGLINYQYKKGNIALNAKEVHQYTIDGKYLKTWNSVMAATLSICPEKKKSHISMAAAGTRKTAMGFKWSYILIEK